MDDQEYDEYLAEQNTKKISQIRALFHNQKLEKFLKKDLLAKLIQIRKIAFIYEED